MNIFFDVDQTILGMDNSLRPGTVTVMSKLIRAGHKLYIWSGAGVRTAVVRHHDLESLICGIYQKPLYDYHQRLKEFGIPITPDLVIDDDPAIVRAFGGVCIPAFYSWDKQDTGMDHVWRIISEFVDCGISKDDRFVLKPPLSELQSEN